MERRKAVTLTAVYLVTSFILACAEFHSEHITAVIAYYGFVLANLGNAVRLVNKKLN